MTKEQARYLSRGIHRFRLGYKNDKRVSYKYKMEPSLEDPHVTRVWLYKGPKMWRYLGNMYWLITPTFERHCPEYDTAYLRLIERFVSCDTNDIEFTKER